MKKRLKKWSSWLLKGLIVSFLTLLLLEIAYRYQWVDFYAKEWKILNRNTVSGKKKMLVFGDSFTAHPEGWLKYVSEHTGISCYNAAISGVGTETYRLLFRERVEAVHPDEVLVQLYVGNDLFDQEKPVNWSELEFGRNVFWSLSNHFRVLNFINYRLGQQQTDIATTGDPKARKRFSVAEYSPRTLLYIRADASYPESTVMPSGNKAELFAQMLENLQEMKATLPDSVTFRLVVIPHCTQVHRRYVVRFRKMGGNAIWHGATNPWVDRLRKAGFEVLDPRGYLNQLEDAGIPVYFENDIHLNAIGQEKFGEWMQKQVEK